MENNEKINIIEKEMCNIYAHISIMKDVIVYRELNNNNKAKLGDLNILLEEVEGHIKNIIKLF